MELKITVEGAPKTGKSAVAQFIKMTLEGIGFVVTLDDGRDKPRRPSGLGAALSAARQSTVAIVTKMGRVTP
jgi:hypothetical protein